MYKLWHTLFLLLFRKTLKFDVYICYKFLTANSKFDNSKCTISHAGFHKWGNVKSTPYHDIPRLNINILYRTTGTIVNININILYRTSTSTYYIGQLAPSSYLYTLATQPLLTLPYIGGRFCMNVDPTHAGSLM